MAISSFSRSGLARVTNVVNPWAVISNTPTGTYTSGDSDYAYFTFTGNGTLTVTEVGFADILVVGGGGGGQSASFSSSGGGGGVRYGIFEVTAGTYTITVGAGGGSVNAGQGTSFGSLLHAGGGSRGRALSGAPSNLREDGGPGGGGGGGSFVIGIGTSHGDGAGAGGPLYGSNAYDGINLDYDGVTTEYGAAGHSNLQGAGAANTGEGGCGNFAGGSGIVIVRVEV